jgi:hypothetical protein
LNRSKRFAVSGAIAVLVLAGIAVALRLLVFASSPGAAASIRAATLFVEATQENTTLGGEGFYSYIVVENTEGKTVRLIGRRGVATPFSLQIPPGTYTIASYQSSCDAACPMLDPPFGRCAKTVTVGSEAVLHVVVSVRPYEGCTIATQP